MSSFLKASVLAETTLTRQMLGGYGKVEGEWESNTLFQFGSVRAIEDLVTL
jgi:hypothetical protein